MKIKIYSLLSILSLTTFAFQANAMDTSCRYRNLLEDNWRKLRNDVRSVKRSIDMPTYHQTTGVCYAYGATQIFDFWRQTRAFMPQEKVELASPIHMALVFMANSEFGKNSLNSGSPLWALQAVKKYGICSKEAVNRDLKEFIGKEFRKNYFHYEGDGGVGYRVEIDAIFVELTEMALNKFNFNDGDLITEIEKSKNFEEFRKINSFNKHFKMFSRDTYKVFYDALSPYLKNKDYVGFLNNVLKSCSKKENQIPLLENMPEPKYYLPPTLVQAQEQGIISNEKEYFDYRKGEFSDKIRSMLNMQNAPALSINLCAKVIAVPEHVGKISFHGDVNREDTCNLHFLAVIGKRKHKGQCQYLVKNTWNVPEYCSLHSGCIWREEIDPETKTPYSEEVGMWINEDQVLNNIAMMTYILPETSAELETEKKWNRIEEKYINSQLIFQKSLQKIRSNSR